MLYVLLILILIICIFLVIYPFIFQNNLEDPLIRELNLKTRKEKLLLELDNELASGVLDKNLHSQLSSEVNQMINIEFKNLDENSKIKIVEVLWNIIYSDNNPDIYENSLMRRLTGLLYLNPKVVGDLKEKVKNNLK